jgi:hypothetical protein
MKFGEWTPRRVREWTFGLGLLAAVSVVTFAFDEPDPCPDLGGAPLRIPCYYYETITAIDNETREVRGKVAESVIDESESRLLDKWEMGGYKDTAWHTHVFRVHPDDFAKIEEKGTYMFVVEPRDPTARICRSKECQEAIEKFSRHQRQA